jgi:hypothetical protein
MPKNVSQLVVVIASGNQTLVDENTVREQWCKECWSIVPRGVVEGRMGGRREVLIVSKRKGKEGERER